MEIKKELLTINKYSRPNLELKIVRGVVVHGAGIENYTAKNLRNYFEGNKKRKKYSSSNYIIGLEGEVIMCVPENEIAYCSNSRDFDTISIKCCHYNIDGKFNEKTLESLKKLLKMLIKNNKLDKKNILRHYDITGKKCPLYFVDYEDKWDKFKNELFEKKLL